MRTGKRYGRPPIDRVMEKVTVTDADCWEFRGARTKAGYGHVKVNGRLVATHRLVVSVLRGPIPDGLELDHLCRNRSCCNPDHLEAVTKAENVRRGKNGRQYRWVNETECRSGHEYTAENTYITPDGHRACRTCNNEASRRYKARMRGAA